MFILYILLFISRINSQQLVSHKSTQKITKTYVYRTIIRQDCKVCYLLLIFKFETNTIILCYTSFILYMLRCIRKISNLLLSRDLPLILEQNLS